MVHREVTVSGLSNRGNRSRTSLFVRILNMLALLAVAFTSGGCPEETVGPEPDEFEYHEYAIDSVTAQIGPGGGTITMPDGGGVIFQEGAVSSNRTITVRRLGGDRYFDAPNRWIYDIEGADGVRMEIRFVTLPGRTVEQIGVLLYNHETFESQELPFSYDPSSGEINVIVPAQRTVSVDNPASKRAEWTGTRVAAEVDELITPESELVRLPVPYYMQDSRTCWATTTKMLSEAYNWSQADQHPIPKFLKDLSTDHVTGINHVKYWYQLPGLVGRVTGQKTEARWYWRSAPARMQLVKLLDDGIPVSMALNLPDHSILVIGYKKTTGTSGQTDYEFLIHDPEDASHMNEWQKWSWFEARKPTRYSFQLVWAVQPPPADRPLQTVGFPMGGIGSVQLQQVTRDCDGEEKTRINGQIGYANTASNGYEWKDIGGKSVSVVSGTTTHLALKLPLWNAEQGNNALVQLVLKVGRQGASSYLHNKTYTLTLPGTSTTYTFEESVPLREVRSKTDNSTYDVTVELWEGGRKIDGYAFSFVIGPLVPTIYEISPCSGPIGTQVTITGSGFGGTKESGSYVGFDDKPATVYQLWSDTMIIATVPVGASTGDVTVFAGGAKSNGLLFEVSEEAQTYTFRPYKFKGYPFEYGDTLICTGSISASSMVIDEDNPGIYWQTIGFTVTGSLPISVRVKRNIKGLDYTLEFPIDDTTVRKEIYKLQSYVLKYADPSPVGQEFVSTDGTFDITLTAANTVAIAGGIRTFAAFVDARYTVTAEYWVRGELNSSSTQTEDWSSLYQLGYIYE